MTGVQTCALPISMYDETEIIIRTSLSREKIDGLFKTRQADMVYDVFGRVADGLAELGFDPAVIATVAFDLGAHLYQREGSPTDLVRIDPRAKH